MDAEFPSAVAAAEQGNGAGAKGFWNEMPSLSLICAFNFVMCFVVIYLYGALALVFDFCPNSIPVSFTCALNDF